MERDTSEGTVEFYMGKPHRVHLLVPGAKYPRILVERDELDFHVESFYDATKSEPEEHPSPEQTPEDQTSSSQ